MIQSSSHEESVAQQYVLRSFPLTPALSLWERECHRLRYEVRPAGVGSVASQIFKRLQLLFPLPKGEGQGEGKGTVLRQLIGRIALAVCFLVAPGVCCAATQTNCEQWGIFEVVLAGPTNRNPFVDVSFMAEFSQDTNSLKAAGFYDGDGVYRVRFMPDKVGRWHYITVSDTPELNGRKGEFTVTAPSSGNHGPVHVANTFHFAYADGKPYKQLGTTCYVWTHQTEALQEQTLKTLASGPFNKIRFCVFPKRYRYNTNEPSIYPFVGTAPHDWEFDRFNPAFFRHFEQRIVDLQKLGIEADIILFHPYDDGHWGFDRMSAVEDDRYLRYVIARLAAYRNVWWSLANEWDFMRKKTEADFVRFGEIISTNDPYHHLLSIHNGTRLFNHTRPWITHSSIQNGAAVEEPGRAEMYRDTYLKPVVYDEVKYEGNIPPRWGQLSPEELVFRFWNGTVAGTYVGHGETYLSPDDILWWSKGGVLKGQSPARLAFLRQVLEDSPAEGINPIDQWQHPEYGGKAPDYYLVYLGKETPRSWEFKLPKPPSRSGQPPIDSMKFTVEVLDTWNMTTESVPGTFMLKKLDDYFYGDKDGKSVPLTGKPYMAIRIKRVKE